MFNLRLNRFGIKVVQRWMTAPGILISAVMMLRSVMTND